ncbi:MAG: tRNA (adenosine(37)-N6)-threonylcarbamoyltransferase complex ATPase subunit type 1 TsaE [Acidimicrobiia bacterium]|nr:tRNA (adenosine(37)-N6)-threonylcarbamoyltransferase complex ATPase subunit type 1 TsaE [Acidimicrobiia bacterium]
MKIDLVCATEADTRAAGRRLASLLRVGDVVLLGGSLGAGKTVFASGIAEGLGVSQTVTSPTFVLAKSYDGLMRMVHADVYRIGSSGEFEDLDLLTEAADGVLVVEWGDVVEQALPDDHLMVRLEPGPDGSRSVSLIAHGSWSRRPLEEMRL